jgi:hypothetical protein
VTLGERLQALLDALPVDWSEAHVLVTVADESNADRAALILAPLTPGRAGSSFRVSIARSGGAGRSPEAVRRVLERLDAEGIDARVSLPGTAAYTVARREPEQRERRRTLAESWDELVRDLPPDWSDVYVEVELASSDDLEPAALRLSPVNPYLSERARPALRFRAARAFGYGAAAAMARRALARLDEAGIAGTLRLLRVHSDVHPAHTQGLVWREGGRAV